MLLKGSSAAQRIMTLGSSSQQSRLDTIRWEPRLVVLERRPTHAFDRTSLLFDPGREITLVTRARLAFGVSLPKLMRLRKYPLLGVAAVTVACGCSSDERGSWSGGFEP